MTRPAPNRLAGLDALRGIAAAAVMLRHFTTDFHGLPGGHAPPGVSAAFPFGGHGVELFFIVSGFVIFMTLERTQSLGDFLVARFARLYPAFLASLALTLAIDALAGGSAHSIAEIAANMTMMPEIFGVPGIDGSYWTLFYELDFYLVAGLVFFLLRVRDPEVPCTIWLLASMALRVPAMDFIPAQVSVFLSLGYSQLFVIGIVLYRIYSGYVTILTVALLIFWLPMTWVSWYWSVGGWTHPEYMLAIFLCAGMVWLATTPRVRIPVGAPFRFLGRISYPLYLVHQLIGSILIARLEAAGLLPDLAVAGAIGVAILLAWGVSAWVEYPAQAWLRFQYRAWRDRRA